MVARIRSLARTLRMTDQTSAQKPEFLFPLWLRAFVRGEAVGLIGVALIIGALSAVFVSALNAISQFAHELLFDLSRGERLSAAHHLSSLRVFIVLTCGGAALTVVGLLVGKRFATRTADAIEANALHGGRLSIGGSLYIVLQTLISNGCGAAVGLEAAYTQICSAFASRIGRALSARRSDIRLLVGCGAAGAIAAAFDAPIAGAFYGFEVVLGAYSVGLLVPVATSAVVASLLASMISGHGILDIPVASSRLVFPALGHVFLLAGLCGFLGIVVMKGVAFVERGLVAARVPALARPVLGGAVVAGLAMLSPAVMGSGHGALQENQFQGLPLGALALIIAVKCAGSAVSLGAGFRGGLFFASLLIGGTFGRFYAETINTLTPFNFDPGAAAVTGLAAFGAGVLGAPMTMTVLALEITGDFRIAVFALVAAAVSTVIVRENFGYSFATWRFHLRGETIRGPADIGWMRDLTVERLMRRGAPTASENLTIAEARKLFPAGSEKQFLLVDQEGRFRSIVLTGDLYASDLEPESPVAALELARGAALTPEMAARDALAAFEEHECDVLAVIDSPQSRHVLGILTEAHALRRYGEELERRHRAVIGQ